MSLEPTWVYPPVSSVLIFILFSIVGCVLFISQGMLISLPLLVKNKISQQYFLIHTVAASCIIGYALYYIFHLSPIVGKYYCLILYVWTVVVALLVIKRYVKDHNKLIIFSLAPILLTLLLSIFYNSLLYSCEAKGKISVSTQYCSIVDTTFDNTLPFSFAKAAYLGIQMPKVSDWTGADRPPLQSGLTLMGMPLAYKISTPEAFYQPFAGFLQCLWIVAFFEFFKRLRPLINILPILIIAVTSNFIFANSVFVWPKLLAGTLLILAILILNDTIRENSLNVENSYLIASLITLSLLAHGGVIFTLIPVFIYAALKLYKILNMKIIFIFLSIFLILYIPWFVYRSNYHIRGDRLIKWWIGGVVQIDDQATSKTIFHSYTSTSLISIVAKKAENVATLFGYLDYNGPLTNRNTVGRLVNLEGSYFIPSLSFSLLGLFSVRKLIILKRFNSPRVRQVRNQILLTLKIGMSSLVVWIVLSFGPPNAPTIAYANSYATFLLIYFGLLAALSLQPKLAKATAVLSFIYFSVTLIANTFHVHQKINLSYVGISLMSLLATILMINFVQKNELQKEQV